MQYQIKILLLSFVITIITSLAIIPILKKLKVGQMERTEGPQSHLYNNRGRYKNCCERPL